VDWGECALQLKDLSATIERRPGLLAWILILPAAAVIGAVILYPVLATFWLSLRDYSLIYPWRSRFIGLGNYVDFFKDPNFWAAIGRTAYFTFVSVGIELVLGIGVAILLNMKLPGWKVLRTLLIVPWAVPTIVNGVMWKWIYNAEFGALNGLLYSLGLIDRYRAWLSEPFTAMNLVIVADVWHSVPFIAIIIMAALATIPEDLYEAARIDGATRIQTFSRLTLPLLRPAITIALVIRTVEAFKVFDIIYIITGGGPANGTQVISYLTYLESFSYLNMGRGAALSFIVSLFILALTLLYIRLLRSEEVA